MGAAELQRMHAGVTEGDVWLPVAKKKRLQMQNHIAGNSSVEGSKFVLICGKRAGRLSTYRCFCRVQEQKDFESSNEIISFT